MGVKKFKRNKYFITRRPENECAPDSGFFALRDAIIVNAVNDFKKSYACFLEDPSISRYEKFKYFRKYFLINNCEYLNENIAGYIFNRAKKEVENLFPKDTLDTIKEKYTLI